MKLALFDFDGTVTTHDSFKDFLIYYFGLQKFIFNLVPLLPYLTLFSLRIIKNDYTKQKVVNKFFANENLKGFQCKAKKFATEVLPEIVRPDMLRKIEFHKQMGHKVVVVSASFEDYLKYWCEIHNLELIATKLESKNGKLTGNFATPNCWGPEKVHRIKKKLNLEDYSYIYAYGDSKGDKEMLALADEAYYKNKII